jgi:hypothetical protein
MAVLHAEHNGELHGRPSEPVLIECVFGGVRPFFEHPADARAHASFGCVQHFIDVPAHALAAMLLI